jgi:hypothetical protein
MAKSTSYICLLFLAVSSAVFAQKPVAQLPVSVVDVSWRLPTGGTTWAAHTSAQFASALNVSQPGDVIVLDAGVIYQGNFRVPAKPNPGGKWIYIISSKLGSLPGTGARVSPSDAVNMPKIVTPNVSQALSFVSGSNHIRIVGVEMYSGSTYAPSGYTPGVFYGYYLVGDAGAFPWAQPIPDSIILDRVYVHGDPRHDLQAGLQVNFSNGAVVDSHVSEIHMKGTDTCAVCAFFTPGPLLVSNNHLEAAGENIIFGGSGGNSDPWVPSDITITGNYLYKPLSWVPLSTGSSPAYVVKNSLELKSAQRVLVDGNTIENKWSAAQVGGAVVLTVRTSQSGDLAVVKDITVTNNILNNVVQGFQVMQADYNCGTVSYPNCHNAGDTDHITIANNLIMLYDTTQIGGVGQHTSLISFSTGQDLPKGGIFPAVKNIVVQHNTVVPYANQVCWGSVYFGVPGGFKPPFPSPISTNVWILDNVLCKQPTGDWGLSGTSGLSQYMGLPNAPAYDFSVRFYGNVMYVPSGNKIQVFPAHNYATTLSFTFVSPLNSDYQLTAPSWTDTTDGKLAGISYSGLARSLAAPGGGSFISAPGAH